jgi:hypothetical protein
LRPRFVSTNEDYTTQNAANPARRLCGLAFPGGLLL